MKTAAAYIRVSTDEQTEYSPDSQLKHIQRYAGSHSLEIPPAYVFIDEGISGKTAQKRPAFLQMIHAAKTGAFDVILVYSLSRFARSREDSVVYKRMLRKDLGIDVISTTQDLGGDKTSILMEALLEAMDEYYSIDLGENVKRGMAEKFSRGEPVCAPPFGYRMDGKAFAPDPEEAPVVRMIFSEFCAGAPVREIAAMLGAMGLRTKRGNPFESRSVRYILRNPVYLGKLCRKQQRRFPEAETTFLHSPAVHPPLVDETRWMQAQELLVQTAGRPAASHAPALQTPLHGLVRCSNCGSRLVASGKHSLQCHAYAKGRCTVSHSISVRLLEQSVFQALEQVFGTACLPRLPAASQDNSPCAALLRRQIAKENRRLIKAREAYENGVDSLDEYGRQKKGIQSRLAFLQQKLQNTPSISDPPGQEKPFLSLLQGEAIACREKQELLQSVLHSIVLDRSADHLSIYLNA